MIAGTERGCNAGKKSQRGEGRPVPGKGEVAGKSITETKTRKVRRKGAETKQPKDHRRENEPDFSAGHGTKSQ